MLDKDFDQFFKSSFEELEIEPATESWTKISDKINPKPKRKIFPVFWMAAASIIIVLGIGIGLYTKPTAVIKLHTDRGNGIIANLNQEENTGIESTLKVEKETDRSVENTPKKTAKISKTIKSKEPTIKNTFETEITVEPIKTDMALVKNAKRIRTKLVTEQILAQEEMEKLKTDISENSANTNKQILAQITTEDEPVSKRRKISTMGDLVNYVVAKVDKREEKIIKISRTEESDNEITGINLGLFKFRKQD